MDGAPEIAAEWKAPQEIWVVRIKGENRSHEDVVSDNSWCYYGLWEMILVWCALHKDCWGGEALACPTNLPNQAVQIGC